MRITRIRVIAQVFFFGLFLFFVLMATESRLKAYPVSWLLELDPLVGFTTAITTREVYRGLLWGVLILAIAFVLGRVFCNWICPYGSAHQFIGWVFGRKEVAHQIESNRYRRMFSVKYILLIAAVLAAIFGTLQIGLLDPIVLLYRSFAVSVLPAVDMALPGSIYPVETHTHQLAWLVGFILLFLLVMNVFVPRFFCRSLCPLGAFLGVCSRPSLWRIHRNADKCTNCNLCLRHCEGASDPHADLRKSECFVCFNCIEDCPHEALSFEFLPGKKGEKPSPEISGRRMVLAGFIGLLFYPLARSSGATTKNYNEKGIRPPGSVEESEFLRRCIKCDQCIRVCPTNVLQPAFMETGLEGLWTPVLKMRVGYCELNCTLCGQVCPTGAIQRITVEEKVGAGEYEGQPVRIGTAFFDRGRCLPWAMDESCVVCQEVCPTTPKAIYTREMVTTNRHGERMVLQQPYVDPRLCIGCGICEHECPVNDKRAIYVTVAGETRSRDRTVLLRS